MIPADPLLNSRSPSLSHHTRWTWNHTNGLSVSFPLLLHQNILKIHFKHLPWCTNVTVLPGNEFAGPCAHCFTRKLGYVCFQALRSITRSEKTEFQLIRRARSCGIRSRLEIKQPQRLRKLRKRWNRDEWRMTNVHSKSDLSSNLSGGFTYYELSRE